MLKAIDKDPTARYQSAEAMGEDLRRFLGGEPIVARPVLFWERALKWARRRPALAAMLVLVHLLLAGLLGLGVWSYVRIGQALETAQDQRRNADMERTVAVAAADREAAARGKADQANASLRDTQEELRRTVYATRSNLALAAWEANHVGRLRLLVDLMRPRQDESDLRGWEWHYLNRLAHEERSTFRDHDREVSQVAFSPDGRTVASVQWGGRIKLWDPATGHVRFALQPPQPSATSPLQSGVSQSGVQPGRRAPRRPRPRCDPRNLEHPHGRVAPPVQGEFRRDPGRCI